MSVQSTEELKSQLTRLPETDSLILANVYEEFFTRRDRGEQPQIAEYTRRYPGMADVILEVFQALGEFERVQAIEAEVETETPVPTSIGGYEVVQRLGAGGMGVVYEGRHPTLSRRVAVKVLSDSHRFSAVRQERFIREAEATSRLCHPNIVPLLDFGNGPHGAYLTMPFVHGASLDHVLKEMTTGLNSTAKPDDGERPRLVSAFASHLSDYRALAALGAEAAAAIGYAHGQRIIHRDIKPANLILDSNGKVWVTDFGLAKIYSTGDTITLAGDVVGTPRYMAPEQACGRCSPQSDIYALGVTLYELAARQKAWDTVSRSQVVSASSETDLPQLLEIAPDVPEGLARVIMKACAFHPNDRYDTAIELECVLRRFAAGHEKADRRRRARVDGERFVRRGPLLIRAVGGCIALVAALALSMLNVPQKLSGANSIDKEPDAAEVARQLNDDQFINEIVNELPEAMESDTATRQENRAKIAKDGGQAYKKVVSTLSLDDSAKDFVYKRVDEFTDAYRRGNLTRQEMKSAVEMMKSATISHVLRFQAFRSDIQKSGLRDSEKVVALNVLKELSPAVAFEKIPPAVVRQLRDKLPKKDQALTARELDAVVRNFIRSAVRSINAIPGVPKGIPGSRTRLAFLQSKPAGYATLDDRILGLINR